MTVGILAFGSIVDDPGDEIVRAESARIEGITTPFQVEFARSSRTRDGAPTLVPVKSGGSAIRSWLIVLDRSVDEQSARDMVYRRESRQVGGDATYEHARTKWIAEIRHFADLDVCLYVALKPNVAPLTAVRLAELAIDSARRPAGRVRRDGISYLQEQKRRGIQTPLMPPYEAEVLARTGSRDLGEAWAQVREWAKRDAMRPLRS
jgi:hypothetical protein